MHSHKLIPFVLAALAACAMGAGQPQRRLFDYERRVGDMRPKVNLTPYSPSLEGRGHGVGLIKAPGWQPNGICLCDTSLAHLPKIVTDGNSGAIVCWTEQFRKDSTDSDYDIYAQRVDSGGNIRWQSQGVPVCSLSNTNAWYPAMISDGHGGAIISWEEWGRDGSG
ncbi:MAG TPA: hypothetical protein VMF29_05710, partial [Candidatus Edwardsbacteria bacterium]|nr:hypothetical protein [Candidatus Edwardsbacteria bacterium]